MITTKQMIELQEWDELVKKTYGRPYSFQQQDGCQPRGVHKMKIPNVARDFEEVSVPEVVNGNEMGVSFAAWLARDPSQKMVGQRHDFELEIFWERSFYPDVQMVANDLHAKGLIPAGEYCINIDW